MTQLEKRVKLEQKQGELTEQVRLLSGKIGDMFRTPKYSTDYSSAKLDAWKKDLERLQGQANSSQALLVELVHSDAYVKEVAQQVEKLVVKRDALKAERQKTADKVKQFRSDAVKAVIEGSDAFKMAEQMSQLEEHAALLTGAIQYYQDAIQRISR